MTKPLLFTPITIRNVVLRNRVVIAPMATYSAVDGIAQDFHFAHWGRLVLGGAGCVFVEATAVTDQGRITNGDMGLWSSAHMPPLKRIADFMKRQGVVPGIQLAHAGRKGSMQRPWFGNGPLTPEDLARGEKTWDIVAPTSEPMAEGYIAPKALSAATSLVWHEVALTGSTAAEFSDQITALQPLLGKVWQARHSAKTGNPVYERPVALVIYRDDFRFLLHDIIPEQGRAKADYDLVLASQPYRARVPVEFKASKVIAPLTRALRPGGRLLGSERADNALKPAHTGMKLPHDMNDEHVKSSPA